MKTYLFATITGLTCCGAASNANADQALLSCSGTVELIQQGRQVNPTDERSSIAIAVDTSRRIITIDKVQWPVFGDASGDTVVAMDPNLGSLTLNRITGSISVHFIQYDGLKKFYGECKPAKRLF
ncbi:hypothetical protein [Bradyrhizobium sp. S3.5.5]|uniref:hypothetical protein n=1 Tax=Bradyrhizobium sp. S3.5.5 TaxID=3156430 RepID=UPI003397D8FD